MIDIPRIIASMGDRDHGITRAQVRTQLRRGQWVRLGHGYVLTRPDEPTRDDWAMLGLHLGGATAAISGWDAIRLADLTRSRTPPNQPVLIVSRHGDTRRCGGVLIRGRARPFTIWSTWYGHPTLPDADVVLAPRAIADYALLGAPGDDIRAIAARAVQQRKCTPEDFGAELAQVARRRSAQLRAALNDIVGGARSAAEADAARRLRGQVPPFEMNVPIRADGLVVAVADFLWRDLRAVLEIDSREFHFEERDWKATTDRHNRLTALGFTLTHYAPSEVRRPGWAAEVAAWLARRAAELR